MTKTAAYLSFWERFQTAYDENSVPDKAPFPYSTCEISVDYFDYPVSLTVSLWDRASGWSNIQAKEREISEAISRGGVMIPYDEGTIWIKRGTPWAQRMSQTDDEMVKRIILNVEVEYIE